MLSHRESGKATHYAELLDAARCNGRWSEIPELTRKVAKHAPQRRCLVLTSQTEYRVSSFNPKRPAVASSGNTNALHEAKAVLKDASEKENEWREDAFQARVCAAWIDISLDDHQAVLAVLPQDLDTLLKALSEDGKFAQKITYVCVVRAAFFRGLALETKSRKKDAVQSYENILPYVLSVDSSVSLAPEWQCWSERLLARYCTLSSSYVSQNAHNSQDLLAEGSLFKPTAILKPYRAWSQFWDSRPAPAGGQEVSHERTLIWKGYYETLSILVRSHVAASVFDSRLQPAIELKRIEAIYQTMLLNERQFPSADEVTPEIESWADHVMRNWRTLLGSAWTNEDLRPGGSIVLGKGILDTLYKMASRSFHSTKILRYLFIVHAALSEFALASKALNSYLEIIKKGKAKQKKSGERNISLDDDATALCTIVCGVEMLCTYGKRKDVEQAQDLVHLIEDWLVSAQSDEDIQVESSAEDTPVDLVDKPKRASLSIPTKIMARAYAAIGLSRRCWALLTYDSISRAKLQESAISAYRSALRSEYGDEDNVEHLYSLAYVLAQTRKLEDAMITVKQAITIGKHLDLGMSKPAMVDGTSSEGDSDFPNRVTLLKCWHLVALLLSARQDFSTAVTSCEAAVDPYGGKKVLSGDLRSLDLPPDLGFVEKRNIIELKMTHIALLEVMGESESFVNKVTELLGLYSRLFKLNDDVNLLKPETRDSSPAPSTTGTRRSFRQSILHLPKNPLRHRLADNESVTSSVGSSKPIANGDAKPAIAITTDDTIVLPQNPKHHQGFLGRHESNKLKKRPSRRSLNSVRKSRASSPSMPPPAKSHDTKHLNLPINPDQDQSMQSDSQDPSIQGSDVETTQYSPDQIGVAMSHNQQSKDSAPIASADHSHPLYTIPSAAENMNKTNPNSNPILPNPPSSSGSRPTTSLMPLIEIPEPHYTPSIQARQARALLCRIWLFMSGVYRRASMYQECQKAINEAREQVKAVEKSIAENEGMSAETYTSPGYGGYKSCGQLWGDVCAEQGALWEAQDNTAKAVDSYEMALSNDGDHLVATASLSNILLDQYATPPNKPAKPKGLEPPPVIPTLGSLPYTTAPDTSVNIDTSEDTLNRLAARDRAYGMLSMLTKSGQGWDSTDAWFAMARVHEESGQAEKAQQTYWWVIELEEAKGVRSWDVIA